MRGNSIAPVSVGILRCMRRSIFKLTVTERKIKDGSGWNSFSSNREKSSVTISRSSALRMIVVHLLKGYAAAGLTAIIARIASDDVGAQSHILLNEIKPQLAG